MTTQKQFFTTREAMTEIEARTGVSVSRNTFYSWLKQGVLSQKRMGKRVFIALSDLNIFLADFQITKQDLVVE